MSIPAAYAVQTAYTFECEFPVTKPTGITEACGDGNTGVDHIKWKSWGLKKAIGVGERFWNDCDPDCADGKTVETEVSVALSKMATIQGKLTYTQLKITKFLLRLNLGILIQREIGQIAKILWMEFGVC